jgi:D-alanyl-lipoteichoic acid acyltransferase DltB (MBOAT superfamily)
MINFEAAGYFANLLILVVLVGPAYARAGTGVRQAILATLGAALLYFVAPRLAILYLAYWAWAGGLSRLMLRFRDAEHATTVMWACVLGALAPMLFWKLAPTVALPAFAWAGHQSIAALSDTLGYLDAHRGLLLPLGLSFATFRALDLILQTYLGSLDRVPFGRVLAYGFCPFVLAVGPIATLQEVDFSRTATREDALAGLARIVSGFVKIFLIASLFQDWTNVFHSYDRPGWQLAAALVVFAFYFYLNFSGYSDIAIGTGRLFGMRLPENFNWPLFRESPQQFWANWHASLSRFAQRYIFAAAGGYRRNRQAIALLATMMVIAWWHDLTLSWTLFGLYHGAGLIVHRYWSQHRPVFFEARVASRGYRLASRLLLFSFVALGFPIISMPPGSLPDFYARLFHA